jgi:hypothetical protein
MLNTLRFFTPSLLDLNLFQQNLLRLIPVPGMHVQ